MSGRRLLWRQRTEALCALYDHRRSPRQHHLPKQAQDIFREAFNGAWRTYAARQPNAREQIAHRVAWAAVKKRYRKLGRAWVPYGW